MKTEIVNVKEVAEHLKFLANFFDYSDWEYTRDTGDLEHIRFRHDYTGYYVWWRRIWRGFGWLFGRYPMGKGSNIKFDLKTRLGMFPISARKDDNLPDGVLHGGGVITFWEETGDYLNLVSPAVGDLLAEWMIAEPKNKYAVKIATLMSKPPSYATEE